MGRLYQRHQFGFYAGVVTAVAPVYYAHVVEWHKESYTVSGDYFDNWPQTIKAYRASNNNNPTQNIGSTLDYNYFIVISRTNTEIVFEWINGHGDTQPGYLGCICDADDNVLWVNNSKPLP